MARFQELMNTLKEYIPTFMNTIDIMQAVQVSDPHAATCEYITYILSSSPCAWHIEYSDKLCASTIIIIDEIVSCIEQGS